MSFSVIILAAGEGTRMNSSLPKVMHKLANQPMLGHILYNIKQLSVSNVMVVIGPDHDAIRDYVGMEYDRARCVVQQLRKGSGDAVKVALDQLDVDHDVLVLYGDHPLITTQTMLQMRLKLQEDQNNALVLASFIAEDPAHYGRLIVNQQNQLLEIIEFNDASDNQRQITLCNSGIMLIKGSLIRKLISEINNNNVKKEYYLTDLVKIARSHGFACQHLQVDEREMLGINNKQELARAETILQTKLRAKFLQQGVTLIAPETVYFSTDTIIGKDVVIHPFVVIGKGVEIANHAEIKSFSHLEGAVIGNHAKTGPFARLRPGAELGEKAVVGNFVEVKNAKIGHGSKVNHLSYIGDATIGKSSNIGAGTITCNYDGFNKHSTSIGSNVFVGSHTAFIAPVAIQDDVIIGAGSIITTDIEVGALAIARSVQRNLPGKAKVIREKNRNKIHLKDM